MKLQNLFILLILTLSFSCTKATNKRSTVDSTLPTSPYTYPTYPTSPTPIDPNGEFGQGGTGVGYGDGNEPGIVNPAFPAAPEYYSINNIITHGTANPNRYAPPGGIIWSSTTGVAQSDQAIFTTNTRFNVRVRAQAGPSQSTVDSRSITCQYSNNIYNKLQVDVCVRSQTGSCISTHTFSDIPIGEVSKVKEFTVPLSTAEPLVVEVLDVQWDYSCIYYGQQGFSYTSGYCPWSPVWDTQCAKFDIQFSTDDTTDLPGVRY